MNILQGIKKGAENHQLEEGGGGGVKAKREDVPGGGQHPLADLEREVLLEEPIHPSCSLRVLREEVKIK